MKKSKVSRFIYILVISVCFSLLLVNAKVNAYGPRAGVSGEVSYWFDDDFTDGTGAFTFWSTYGTPVVFTASSIEGKEFLFWSNLGKVISVDPSLTIPIYGHEFIAAHYKVEDTFVTVYMDANNDFLLMTDGSTGPVGAPPKLGYSFDGWVFPGDGLTEDTYIRATYTAIGINPVTDESGNPVKMVQYLDQNQLAFVVDVDLGGNIVEMGVVYNFDGDPQFTAGTNLRRAYRYSSNFEFAVLLGLDVDAEVYAYAYAVTEASGVYTTQYSRLITVKNITINYSLDSMEHMIPREQLIAEFMLDFNANDGNPNEITASQIYGAGGPRQQAFWTNSEMLNKWGGILQYFKSFNTHVGAVAMYDQILAGEIPTETSYWAPRQDLQGFMTETRCASYSSGAAIDFSIAANAYSYGNSGEPTTQMYDGDLPTAFKVGHTFVNWLDETDGVVLVPTESMTLYPSWTPISYDITYNKNEGVLTTTINSYTILDDLMLDIPIKDGSLFAGWYDNPAFTGTPIENIVPHTRYGDLTLYVKWIVPGPEGFVEAGGIAINTYDTSIWSGSATKIYLDPNGTGSTNWYRVILKETSDPGVFEVRQIIISPNIYTFAPATDKYSIHVHPDNSTGYNAVIGLGIAVGDKVTFPGTNLGTLVTGDQDITATIWKPE